MSKKQLEMRCLHNQTFSTYLVKTVFFSTPKIKFLFPQKVRRNIYILPKVSIVISGLKN